MDFLYPRRIVVDDTDPRITYNTGTWNLDLSSFASHGIAGDPYNQTMRGTNSATASFRFHFEGDYIQVKGAKDNSKYRHANATHDSPDDFPRYTCQVDGLPIEQFVYHTNVTETTNLILCEGAYLSKRNHTLIMTTTVGDKETQVFWLDSIEYAPLDNANLTNQVVRVDSSDKSCVYFNETGQEWQDGGRANGTGKPRAGMSFKFNGTSVSLYGQNLPLPGLTFGLKNSTAVYSIDNADHVPFTISGSKPFPAEAENDTMWLNQHVFTTNRVDGGREHEMVITYTGAHNMSESPQGLDIDYFYVTNDWIQTNDSSSGLDEKTKTPVGAIIGGVLGVSVLITIAGLIWLMMRKRRGQGVGMIKPNHERSILTPFNGVKSTATGTSIKHAYGQGVELNERVFWEQDSGSRSSQTDASSSVLDPPPSYTSG
ncbi:hypothetical protein PQX77_011134 [Marasmius sp. AFHP31]|nr:hypothetical protein PQX77_012789 [Marasmius sp. AFHP31]KAK1225901.1 hypothetical protein PQX77_011134 [Marasmius sp. AFHP31]